MLCIIIIDFLDVKLNIILNRTHEKHSCPKARAGFLNNAHTLRYELNITSPIISSKISIEFLTPSSQLSDLPAK